MSEKSDSKFAATSPNTILSASFTPPTAAQIAKTSQLPTPRNPAGISRVVSSSGVVNPTYIIGRNVDGRFATFSGTGSWLIGEMDDYVVANSYIGLYMKGNGVVQVDVSTSSSGPWNYAGQQIVNNASGQWYYYVAPSAFKFIRITIVLSNGPIDIDCAVAT
jgi:hypothetical protein